MPAIPLEKLPILARLLNEKLTHKSQAVRRDALGVILGLHGLRNKEACELRWRVLVELKGGTTEIRETIDPARKQIWVETIKGGRKAWVPATDYLLAALAVHRARQKPPSEFVLSTRTGKNLDTRNLRRRWKQWVIPLIGDFRFHDLRHTLAKAIWKNSHGNVLAVQKLLRHVNIQNTAIYLHTPEEVRSWLPTAHFSIPQLMDLSPSETCAETSSSDCTAPLSTENTSQPESSYTQQSQAECPQKLQTTTSTSETSPAQTYKDSKELSETGESHNPETDAQEEITLRMTPIPGIDPTPSSPKTSNRKSKKEIPATIIQDEESTEET